MAATTTTGTRRRDEILQHYEAMWSAFDQLFAGMSAGDWQRKHGPDWVFADLPYHLSYFDRDVIVEPLRAGTDLPPEKRWSMPSLVTINEWNAREFAQRPSRLTVDEALKAMRGSRAAIRHELARLNDADLEQRAVWNAFVGWCPIGVHLQTGLGHTWNHVNEIYLRRKQGAPDLPAAVNHAALSFYMALMQAFANPAALGGKSLTVSYDFGAAGAWTIAVQESGARLSEGAAATADVTMKTDPVYFTALLTKARNPMLLMLTRKIKVNGLRNMGRMGKVFAEPAPDQEIFPVNEQEPEAQPA